MDAGVWRVGSDRESGVTASENDWGYEGSDIWSHLPPDEPGWYWAIEKPPDDEDSAGEPTIVHIARWHTGRMEVSFSGNDWGGRLSDVLLWGPKLEAPSMPAMRRR